MFCFLFGDGTKFILVLECFQVLQLKGYHSFLSIICISFTVQIPCIHRMISVVLPHCKFHRTQKPANKGISKPNIIFADSILASPGHVMIFFASPYALECFPYIHT